MKNDDTDNFDSDGTAALKLRRPEAKTLILMVAQEKE
jgi:hypothetical protein